MVTRKASTILPIGMCMLAVLSPLGAYGGTAASSGTTSKSGRSGLTTVRFADQPGSGPTTLLEVAVDKGFLRAQGIEATLIPFTTGPAIATALVTGNIDVATSAPEQYTPLVSQGEQLQLFAGASKNVLVLASRKDLDLPRSFPASVKALAGKTVAVTALGSTVQYATQAVLTAVGLSPDAVTFVAAGGNMDTALIAGRVDAAMLFGSQVIRATAGGARILVDMRTASSCPRQLKLKLTVCGAAQIGSWAKTDWITRHPKSVRGIRIALAKADVYLHSKAGAAYARKFIGGQLGSSASPSELTQWVHSQLKVLTAAYPKRALKEWITFDKKYNVIKSLIDVNHVYARGTPASARDVAKLAHSRK